jgi:hypothetical protein
MIAVKNCSYIAVAFCADEATQMFATLPDLRGVYCVVPPRSMFAMCAADALNFFNGEDR